MFINDDLSLTLTNDSDVNEVKRLVMKIRNSPDLLPSLLDESIITEWLQKHYEKFGAGINSMTLNIDFVPLALFSVITYLEK